LTTNIFERDIILIQIHAVPEGWARWEDNHKTCVCSQPQQRTFETSTSVQFITRFKVKYVTVPKNHTTTAYMYLEIKFQAVLALNLVRLQTAFSLPPGKSSRYLWRETLV